MPQPFDPIAFADRFRAEPQSMRGKRVIVTGGTTGIGRATAMLLYSRGARVLTFGRHEKELNDAMTDIKSIGGDGEIIGLTADVVREEDIRRVFDEADNRLGGLDAVVCNAGMAASSVLDSEISVVREALDTNLLAYMLCCRFACERMRPKKDGHLVCIGSMSAKGRGAGSDIYVATKMGIRGFVDSLAKQVNEEGIRVTLIEPGLVDTPFFDNKPRIHALEGDDIARAVMYAVQQPPHVDVNELLIRPTAQPT